MKTDVLVDLFFKDLPLEKRVAEIASCGYKYVETWGGGDAESLKKISAAGDDNGISLVSIVMNFATEDDIAPVRKENLNRFLERIDRYSDHALAAGCRAGIVTSGNLIKGMAPGKHKANLVSALNKAGEIAGKKDFQLNLEPLNTLVDHAGYYLYSRENAVEIIKEVNRPGVKILYDIYHMEIMTGNQVDFITNNIDFIGHLHSAGVPGRHELFYGETNYPFVLEKTEAAGYRGYLGLEYFPLLESRESLKKTLAHLTAKKGRQ